MERTGNQRKRANVWQAPTFPRRESTAASPSKSGFEKRKLSVRSRNAGTTTATTTPTSTEAAKSATTSSLPRQPGKENESPFVPPDHAGNVRATTAKTTTKRKRSSDTATRAIGPGKNIIRRRLRSGDYGDRLSPDAASYVRGSVVEPTIFTPMLTDRRDIGSRQFAVYDEERDTDIPRDPRQSATAEQGHAPGPHDQASATGPEILAKEKPPRRVADAARSEARGGGPGVFEACGGPPAVPAQSVPRDKLSTIPRYLYSLWKSHQKCESRRFGGRAASTSELAEYRVRIDESPGDHLKFVDPRSNGNRETSGGEFRIERVDRHGGGTSATNNRREVKSSSDIGRLRIPIRRGDDISPLKRRINQLKRSTMIAGRSGGADERGPIATTVSWLQSAVLPRPGIASKRKEATAPRPDRTSERSCYTEIPTVYSSTVNRVSREIPFEIHYATDYARETIDLERAREGRCYKISQRFLRGRPVTPDQRGIVVNFLISVHAYLLTSSNTLHQAIRMLDAVLDARDVPVEELQLVALGALWIAMKNMETRVPTASQMISFAKDMYRAGGPGLLCKCERKILKTLGFNVRFPDPIHISAYYLRQLPSPGTAASEPSVRRMVDRCAGYLMDVALLDEGYSGTPAELLAAAATQTAARLVLPGTDCSPWINEEMTGCTQGDIERLAEPLLKGVLDSAEKASSGGAVYKKYNNARYENTSDYLVTEVRKLTGLTRAN